MNAVLILALVGYACGIAAGALFTRSGQVRGEVFDPDRLTEASRLDWWAQGLLVAGQVLAMAAGAQLVWA